MPDLEVHLDHPGPASRDTPQWLGERRRAVIEAFSTLRVHPHPTATPSLDVLLAGLGYTGRACLGQPPVPSDRL